MARDMAPEIVTNVSSLLPREATADPKGQREIIRTGKRDKKSRESRNFLTSNARPVKRPLTVVGMSSNCRRPTPNRSVPLPPRMNTRGTP
jgi:hypothetical protein